MRRLFIVAVLGTVFSGFAPHVDLAHACPGCKTANETNDARPRAYMYSILFMLAVPATVLTGFGIGFYRLSKQQQALNQLAELDAPRDAADDEGLGD